MKNSRNPLSMPERQRYESKKVSNFDLSWMSQFMDFDSKFAYLIDADSRISSRLAACGEIRAAFLRGIFKFPYPLNIK